MSQLDVSIMGQNYRLSCRDEEEGKLLQAVAYVDGQMRTIRESGKIRGTDRIAVMACISMAAELLKHKSPDAPIPEGALTELREKIESMTRTIDSAIEA
ncbi:MAG: cell division protein ZapA [Oxalobacter sp.]|jgi:cell division protein ZapA|nr:cell division protein ZapA [Oxalobacter sp.]MBR6000770.1 cell division protein ZapA [Oxalobacter sp.]